MPEQQEYISTTKAAKILSVTTQTVRNMALDGRLGYIDLGTRIRVSSADVIAFLEPKRKAA